MPDPETEPKLETTRLGSYTIVRKLARGGMAELFLARSVGPEGFEKLVVLKKILPKYAENPRFVQLFLDEAKLAASLDHPHIAHVYDMGRVDGHYFFTMEYVHGQDVRSILRRTERNQKKSPIEIAVQIARNIASALHYAHERRRPDGTLRDIVHRDVSPSNILVSYDGAIKLADFGVAKASSSTVRTRTGTLKGKVGYMSPEQARGAPIDRRSDIFSLGVVLWELVAIRRLFKCDNDLATIQAIINLTPPPLAPGRDDCPPELDRIVGRALAKDPETRYQTAQELQKDLEELAREHKLNQSSIALSNYMGELFEPELAAVRKAEATGVTVTEIITHHDLTTPVSESELSLEDESLSDVPDDDDDDADLGEADSAEPTVLPPVLPPAAGLINNDDDDLDDATDFGPPPIMDSVVTKLPVDPLDAQKTALGHDSHVGKFPLDPLDAQKTALGGPSEVVRLDQLDAQKTALGGPSEVIKGPLDLDAQRTAVGGPESQVTKLPIDPIEAQKTAVQVNPFSENAITSIENPLMKTAVRSNPFADEQPTVQQGSRFPDEGPTTPVPGHYRPSVLVSPQTPPGGMPQTPGGEIAYAPTEIGGAPLDLPWSDENTPSTTLIPPPMQMPMPAHGSQPPFQHAHVHTPMGGMPMMTPPEQPVQPYPTVARGTFDSQPIESVSITPSKNLLYVLGAIVIVLLLLVIVLAVKASGNEPREQLKVRDTVIEEPAKPAPAPTPAPKPAAKPAAAKPAPAPAPPPPVEPTKIEPAAGSAPPPAPPVRPPARPFKPPRR